MADSLAIGLGIAAAVFLVVELFRAFLWCLNRVESWDNLRAELVELYYLPAATEEEVLVVGVKMQALQTLAEKVGFVAYDGGSILNYQQHAYYYAWLLRLQGLHVFKPRHWLAFLLAPLFRHTLVRVAAKSLLNNPQHMLLLESLPIEMKRVIESDFALPENPRAIIGKLHWCDSLQARLGPSLKWFYDEALRSAAQKHFPDRNLNDLAPIELSYMLTKAIGAPDSEIDKSQFYGDLYGYVLAQLKENPSRFLASV